MTLDEFREYTKDMRGDVELFYCHGFDKYLVNTFYPLGDFLVLGFGKDEQDNNDGIFRAMLRLRKRI